VVDVSLEAVDLATSAGSCFDAMPDCDFVGCDLGCV
jgi:hypothetical protein